MGTRQTYRPADAVPVRHRAEPRVVVNQAAVVTAVSAFAIGVIVGMTAMLFALLPSVMDHADWSLNMGPDTLPPCATEDSDGCYWDADTMGNGQGHDVVNLPATTPRCTDRIADTGGICWGEPR